MQRVKWFCIILLLFSVGPASAHLEYYEIEDVTNFTVDYAGTNDLITYITIEHIDPDNTPYVNLDTDTFNFSANISTSAISIIFDFSYEDKSTGNITTGSEKWFKTPFAKVSFFFGSVSDGMPSGLMPFDNNVYGSSGVWPKMLVLGPVLPSSSFTLTSDSIVDLKWATLDADAINLGFLENIKSDAFGIIRSIPFIGEYVYQILSIISSIVSAFVIFAYISIKNWTLFFVVFETFVFFHATSVLQNHSGKSSAVITESFKVMASDNKLLIDFLINVFTQIINMFVGAVRMFRG